MNTGMLILAHIAVGVLLQVPRPRGTPNTTIRGSANTEAIATFDGIFKSADKKFLFIGVENGETMRMYITGSTKFIREGKPAHAKDFKTDEKVTVEAERDARLNMIAVRVELTPPPPAKPR
jgi:hypothetical protein